MITELDADEEDERVAIEMFGTSPPTHDPQFDREAFYEHHKMRLQARDERYLRRRERETCRKIIDLGIETATHRPATHFHIDLCREGMTEPETTRANEKSSGLEDTEGRHLAADLRGISIDPVQGDVRLGALSSSDGSERWDYGRHDDCFGVDGDRF